jgi:hypothetical protein
MVVAFLVVWLLSFSRGGSDSESVSSGAKVNSKVISGNGNTNSQLPTQREFVQLLQADAQFLGQVLKTHVDSPPNQVVWSSVRGKLESLLERFDELHLICAADQVVSATANMKSLPVGVVFESVIASFREDHAGQGIQISGHVAPSLVNQHVESTPAVIRLVDLLLREAARQTGHGQIRLNFQPGQEGSMNIEILGTSPDGQADTQAANGSQSLSLSAARSLASALKGRIDGTSITSHGPWFSAIVPIAT